MVFVRKSAWANGGDFSDPTLLWYARGVGILKSRPITDKTSWLFLAGIHGFDPNIWGSDGFLGAGDPLPSNADQNTYWNQCQHQTWYFLPWHRGYLASLEAIVRDAIIGAGGPADWALPYWNYSDSSNSNVLNLPPAFTTPVMPDGTSNPLFVEQRFGAMPLPTSDVALDALTETLFAGTPGGDPGFGGIETGFSHVGGISGDVESLPHNVIHTDVGGIGGLMSDPVTAALDPIFYLHHCNIDRLWEVWLCIDSGNTNPLDQDLWMNGPADSEFIVPLPGGKDFVYTPKMVVDTTAANLNYEYDDIGNPLAGVPKPLARLAQLGAAPKPELSMNVNITMGNKPNAELMGANNAKITLVGDSTSTQVKLDKQMIGKVTKGFAQFAAAPNEAKSPDRIFLNLENIRSNVDGPVIDVYVNLPADANPAEHPENRAGTIALFGVRKASQTDQPHGGIGMTRSLEITHVVDALHLGGNLNDLSNLNVRLVPRTPLTKDQNVTVERISVYRQDA